MKNCDVWMHNSKPEYPSMFNQTACVRAGNNTTTPVSMHWAMQGDPDQTEDMMFTGFKAIEHFPADTFVPPSPCPFV
jgi:hypothetical protein